MFTRPNFTLISFILLGSCSFACGGSRSENSRDPSAVPEPVVTQKTTVDVTDANQPKVDQTNREHPDSAQATGNVEDGVEGGVEGGVVGGVVGTSAPIDYRLVEANTTPDTAVLFRTEMNAPKQVSGPSLVEGIQVSESGSWYGRCTIKTDGSVTHCKVLRSIPAIDKQLVKNLEAQKYTPVIYRGRPQTVFYTFKVVFK